MAEGIATHRALKLVGRGCCASPRTIPAQLCAYTTLPAEAGAMLTLIGDNGSADQVPASFFVYSRLWPRGSLTTT
jgi:hypothetical protein